VRRQTEWRPAQIREREAELLAHLYRLWDISPPPHTAGKAAKPRSHHEVTAQK